MNTPFSLLNLNAQLLDLPPIEAVELNSYLRRFQLHGPENYRRKKIQYFLLLCDQGKATFFILNRNRKNSFLERLLCGLSKKFVKHLALCLMLSGKYKCCFVMVDDDDRRLSGYYFHSANLQ